MKSLIVGITGCAGSHLADCLLEKGFQVFGTKRKTSSLHNIEHILNKIELLDIELDNRTSIIKILHHSQPDQIYFFVSAKHNDTIRNIYKTNVEGTLNFFKSLSEISCRARIVMTSSSAVYGTRRGIHALCEDDKLLPSTYYGLAKIIQEQIVNFHLMNNNLEIIIARAFNHPGPREKPVLVCSDFARQIVSIERGLKDPLIKVGNLENRRDFTDVRDIVKGYALLAEKGKKGQVYNLCSGQSYTGKTILDKLILLSTSKFDVKIDPQKMASMETNAQVGDNSKISSEPGWKPEILLDETLEDILAYYRREVR